MIVPAMTVPTMPMTCHQSRRYSMVTMRLRRREVLKEDVGEMSSRRSNRFSCFAICGSSVSYVYVVCNNSTLHYVMSQARDDFEGFLMTHGTEEEKVIVQVESSLSV